MKNNGAISLLTLLVCGAVGCARPAEVPAVPPAQLESALSQKIGKTRDAVLARPESDEAWGEYGIALRAFGFHEEARKCFREAERLDQTDPRWPFFLARSPYGADPEEALRWLRRAVELCGNKPPAPRYYLARALAEENRWAEAEPEIAALLDAHPAFAPAVLLRAQAELARTNFAAAEALLERCARDPRTRKSAAALRAQLRQRLGDPTGARAAAQLAASLPADLAVADLFEQRVVELRQDPLTLAEEAHRLLAARDLTNVARVASILEHLHPSAADTWLVVGRLRLLQGNGAAAEAALRKHLAIQPESVQGLFQLGLAQMSMNQFAAAATAFEKAVRLKPDFGPGWFNRGFALARSGRLREAIGPFREAIRHNPEHADSYLLLADIHLQLNEPAAASNLVNKAALIQPRNPRLPVMQRRLGL